MKIYTSYFGNMKRLMKAGLVPIGISQFPPKFFYGNSMKELAPAPFMLGKDISPKQYVELFNSRILGKLKQGDVLKKLEQLAMGRDVVLLCFEKDPEGCHRTLVANWLNKAGFIVEEFEAYRNKPSQPLPPQLSLFGMN
jgi:uncharacterized protein YeaO (DUF488 family)